MSSGDESDVEPMSTYMLEDIRDGGQSCLIINNRQAHYNIHDCLKKRQAEWKGALLSTQNMGKGLHKVFNAVINEISKTLPIFCE